MNERTRRRLALLLHGAALLALALLALGALRWPGAALCQRAGLVVLLAAPWTAVALVGWSAWRSDRKGSAILALTLLAVAAAALALGLG
jgi:hypothetical protein